MKAIFSFLALMIIVAFAALLSVVPVRAHGGWQHIFGMSREKGSGVLESEDRDVGAFTHIEVAVPIDVNVTIGKSRKVTVTIDDNLLDNIRTRVHNGVLEISSRHSFSTEEAGRIDIQVENLEGLTLSGSGTVKVFDLGGDKFDFSLAGSGDFEAQGKVKRLSMSLDGSGDIDTRKLDADEVTVVINGSGNAKVTARSSIEGVVNGSGDIEFTGDPEHVSRHVNGSGRITRES
jgi:hypothetical protein